jgi:uncharacterized protein (TIGR03546 family)
MLTILARILSAMNSDDSPGQLSLAVVLALIFGLTPLASLHNVLVLFLVCILRVNITLFLVAWGFFTTLAYVLDPMFDSVGRSVLSTESLVPLWTDWYNEPLMRITEFNNTITMGSLVCSLILSVPVFFLSFYIITQYREHLLKWIEKSKLVQVFKASKIYTIYVELAAK